MPGITTHCAQAALSSAVIYPFAGGLNAAVFGLAVVLIDLDHVIEYVRQTGSYKLWGVFPSCTIVSPNLSRGFYVLNAFHTLEFLLIVGVLGLLHPAFFYAAAGVLWHCALDLVMLARKKVTFMRALSIVEYIIRARAPGTVTRFHDLMRKKDTVIPEGAWNYPRWIEHWRRCTPLC